MTPGQQVARQGVEGLDRFHFWNRREKRLKAGHQALDQLAASSEEPLATSARVLQAMAWTVQGDARHSLYRVGLERMATTPAQGAASATSWVAGLALAAAQGQVPAEEAALQAIPTSTTMEAGVAGCALSAHQRLALLADPGRVWKELPDQDLLELGRTELQQDKRPAARWLESITDPRGVRAGLQADRDDPRAVARAVHQQVPLKLSQLQGLGWDGWLEQSGEDPRWVDALLQADGPLQAAELLSHDPEAHRLARQEVLSQRPEMFEGLKRLEQLAGQCRVDPMAARACERAYLAGPPTCSLTDLAARVEEHADPVALRQVLSSQLHLAAIPVHQDGPYALSAALAQSHPERAIMAAVDRLSRAQDKLAVLACSQDLLAARLARAQTTPWTRVRASIAALREPGSVLQGGVKALESCQTPEQEKAVAEVVRQLCQETWGQGKVVGQYLERLESTQGVRELAELERQGVLQLVAGRPTGAIQETETGVIVGGVVLPRRD